MDDLSSIDNGSGPKRDEGSLLSARELLDRIWDRGSDDD